MLRKSRRSVVWLVAATVSVAIAPPASSGAGSTAPEAEDYPTPADRVQPGVNLARIVFPTRATAGPGRGRVLARPQPTAPLGGAPTQLRVVAQELVRGNLFVRVLLPQRPNGAAGWISDDGLLLLRSRWRVRIDRGRRALTVFRDGRVVKRHRVVVGKPSSPTPRGEFAISEVLPQRPMDDFLGTWILPLTAYSGTYRQFGGGPGLVAMHGRSGASLRDPLGTAASHGCIRLANRAIGWIASHVPAGSAVSIR